ncbi:hypothetical protein EVAR_36112_1 [Eumeta japonica]|uniref:Uncharacterized protein n=1 Tax=Eumeta variegata TaxID=151549 RepID=A0A4C1X2W3_EUMVA|nr:hypothetical protein EVAR_36112_1 [Eumeta japonica]
MTRTFDARRRASADPARRARGAGRAAYLSGDKSKCGGFDHRLSPLMYSLIVCLSCRPIAASSRLPRRGAHARPAPRAIAATKLQCVSVPAHAFAYDTRSGSEPSLVWDATMTSGWRRRTSDGRVTPPVMTPRHGAVLGDVSHAALRMSSTGNAFATGRSTRGPLPTRHPPYAGGPTPVHDEHATRMQRTCCNLKAHVARDYICSFFSYYR